LIFPVQISFSFFQFTTDNSSAVVIVVDLEPTQIDYDFFSFFSQFTTQKSFAAVVALDLEPTLFDSPSMIFFIFSLNLPQTSPLQ